VEHLCGKCASYASNWSPVAEELWKSGKKFNWEPASGYADKDKDPESISRKYMEQPMI
jgi:hypothetical protein